MSCQTILSHYPICDNVLCSPGAASGGISREQLIDQIACDVLNKLPVEFDLLKIRRQLGVDISPTTVVLLQVDVSISFLFCFLDIPYVRQFVVCAYVYLTVRKFAI